MDLGSPEKPGEEKVEGKVRKGDKGGGEYKQGGVEEEGKKGE